MYYDFNFDRDALFFEGSPTIQFIKGKLVETQKQFRSNTEPTILNTAIKLWSESVIKHNLDINMMGIDYLKLISHQNSKEVLDTIGEVMSKDKGTRTPEDFELLRTQKIVTGQIELMAFAMYDVPHDICNDLKREFLEFKNPVPQFITNRKP